MSIKEIEEQAVDVPAAWSRQHVEQYLATDGEAVDHPRADNMILLYTTGRKSGDIRRVPVVHLPDGDDLIVIASKGGAPDNPDWYHNLVGDPNVVVRRKGELFEAIAEVLDGIAYDDMWARVTTWAPAFQEYQDRTERRIPLVRLRPV